MEFKYYYLGFLVMMFLAGTMNAQVVGTASIHAPALIAYNNTGTITVINLTVTKGDGYVNVTGPISVGSSTLNSSKEAVAYAAKYLGINKDNYNFTYTINDRNASVSGPSAGMAMTLLAISSLTHKHLLNNFTLTGEILPNGNIGEIGGVYDKVSAAKHNGLKFVLVPAVSNTSFENELYYLIELKFNIPVIPVANISDAIGYAIDGKPISGKEVRYQFYTNYHLNKIPNATLSCIGPCYTNYFEGLANFTLNMTSSELQTLESNQLFYNATSQFSGLLNQSKEISSKGYYYTAADIAFLDYANIYTFLNSNQSIPEGLSTVNAVESKCNSIQVPQMTNRNFLYLIGGELRQLWGEYTSQSTAEEYNATTDDSDGVIRNLYSAGVSNAWCDAASYMYNASSAIGGLNYTADSSLSKLAYKVVENASNYPGIYAATAVSAYKSGNYPLAIYDGAYAYTIDGNSGLNMTESEMLNSSKSISYNSTYGIWATQFANEAMFYYYEAKLATNTTQSDLYAVESYHTALLANELSNYSKAIYDNLTVAPVVTKSSVSYRSILSVGILSFIIMALAVIIVILLILIVIVVRIENKISELSRINSRSQISSNNKAKNTKRFKNRRK